MNRTTLYLPAELQRALKVTARRTGRPQAELMREALEAFLRQQPRQLPSSIGIAAVKGVSAAEDEDWLRKHWGKS